MPSTNSVSMRMPLPSSTVMTPSLPTFSMTSAMISPISGSWPEMVAPWAICSLPVTGAGAQRHADGVGQGVHAVLELAPGLLVKQQLLCGHHDLQIGGWRLEVGGWTPTSARSEEHTSELQSR